jgi:hypothetical protein
VLLSRPFDASVPNIRSTVKRDRGVGRPGATADDRRARPPAIRAPFGTVGGRRSTYHRSTARRGVTGARSAVSARGGVMTRVLVVHHDIDLSDQEVDSLRRRGYDARQCLGPIGASCPILSGLECSLAEDADVLVYDAFVTGEPEGAQALIEGMREMHPEVPIVLVASGMEPAWAETAGLHGVTPLVGRPTGERLAEAIEAALAEKARERGTGEPEA